VEALNILLSNERYIIM